MCNDDSVNFRFKHFKDSRGKNSLWVCNKCGENFDMLRILWSPKQLGRFFVPDIVGCPFCDSGKVVFHGSEEDYEKYWMNEKRKAAMYILFVPEELISLEDVL